MMTSCSKTVVSAEVKFRWLPGNSTEKYAVKFEKVAGLHAKSEYIAGNGAAVPGPPCKTRFEADWELSLPNTYCPQARVDKRKLMMQLRNIVSDKTPLNVD